MMHRVVEGEESREGGRSDVKKEIRGSLRTVKEEEVGRLFVESQKNGRKI